MQIRFSDRRPDGDFTLVVLAASTDAEAVTGAGGELKDALVRRRFDGEAGTLVEHFTGGRRMLAVGTGKTVDGASIEKVGGAIVAHLLTSGETAAVVDLDGVACDADTAARLAAAMEMRSWRYDRYRTRLKDKQKVSLNEITIVGSAGDAEQRYNDRWKPVVEGVALTREVVTEPANIIYPETFVDRVRASVEGSGLEIEVLDGAAMAELGMGALLGVAQGSVRDPRLLIMRWNGGADGAAPTAFVGKGVTFDTGGISIKPAAGMEMMKWDMGGAGAVVGAMKTVALRKAKANIVGICGLVENMPDGNAQRPGDVVTTMSGQTVEVINTDAEGRLVLGDAITYAIRTYKPSIIIDLATLTGAILISLGHEYAGLFANDDRLAEQLTAAGKETGDQLWRMPMADSFDRLIDSPIADMKNVGPREGGSITAAQFIKRFVENGVRWAHIDMAGKAWGDKAGPTHEKGATGFGVRLLDRYVEDVLER